MNRTYIKSITGRKALHTVITLIAVLLTGGTALAQVKVHGNVYGGGNLADVQTNTAVNISAGQVAGNVFGGGKGEESTFTCEKAMVGIDGDGACEDPSSDANKDKGTKVTISNGTVGTLETVDGQTKVVEGTGNVYGGGSLGSVNGDVTSTLTDCTVTGSVFGAGFSATTPTIKVMNKENFVEPPSYDYNAGVFNDEHVQFPDEVEYTWTNDASKFTLTGSSASYFYDSGDIHLIYTSTSLSDLGRVTGTVKVNIEGNTLIKGYEFDDGGNQTTTQSGGIYGGGDASGVTGSAEVTVNASSQQTEGYNVYNIYGGGNHGSVLGNTTVTLQGNTQVNGNVFGGGNEGDVSGSATVNIED